MGWPNERKGKGRARGNPNQVGIPVLVHRKPWTTITLCKWMPRLHGSKITRFFILKNQSVIVFRLGIVTHHYVR